MKQCRAAVLGVLLAAAACAPESESADAGLGPGAACAAASSPGCADGLLCVQTAPPYCGGDYIGVCAAAPSACTGEPLAPVCTCDGMRYDNACEARRAGVVTYLASC